MVQSINHKGYKTVCLNDKDTLFVHRLVAMAFVKNEFNKPEVNHIDGNKLNNHYTNLEQCTTQENIEHKKLFNLEKLKKLNWQQEDKIILRLNLVKKMF